MSGQIVQFPALYSTSPSTTVTNYGSPLGGGPPTATTENTVWQVVGGASARTLSKWQIKIVTAPGAGKQYLYTIRISPGGGIGGFADTAAAITIANTNTSGSWTGSITLNPGDWWSLSIVPTGTPAATGNTGLDYYFTMATSRLTFIPSCSQTFIPASTTRIATSINQGGISGTEAETFALAIPGTFQNAYFAVNSAPGVGGCKWELQQNFGYPTGLLTGTVSAAAQTANDLIDTQHFVQGDRAAWAITNGLNTSSIRADVDYIPDSGFDGWSTRTYGIGLAAGQSGEFSFNGEGISTVETNHQVPMYACAIGQLWLLAETSANNSTPIGAGETATMSIRKNGSTVSTVSITGPALTNTNNVSLISFADGDLISIMFANTSANQVQYRFAWGIFQTPNLYPIVCDSSSLIEQPQSLVAIPA